MQPTRISQSRPDTEAAVQSQEPLMLHCCCGPCATACLERLADEKRQCALFFSNSNLDSEEEFEKRLDALRTVAGHFGVTEVIVDPYRHDMWLEHISQVPYYDKLPEKGVRCAKCFQWSLGRTAVIAAQRGIPFATTLTVSRHKPSKLLFSIGQSLGNFAPYDFKKQNGFLRSTLISKELGIYRQNYCGCEFSKLNNANQSFHTTLDTENKLNHEDT